MKAKMKSLPMVGNVLSNVPTMFRLVNSCFKGEYSAIPRKQLLITLSALTYLVSPIDLIPDFIPVAGLIDDMAVVGETSKDARSPVFSLKSFWGRRVAGSVVLGIAGRY